MHSKICATGVLEREGYQKKIFKQWIDIFQNWWKLYAVGEVIFSWAHYSFDRCLNNKQSLKIEIVSPSGKRDRFCSQSWTIERVKPSRAMGRLPILKGSGSLRLGPCL
jgi:hypothetical protein